MKIGIIGAGALGRALAFQLVKAGFKVVLSNSRGPDSLATLAAQLGPSATAGTRQQAAQADIVIVSVQWQQLPAALGDLPDWGGRIVIDTTNPILPGFKMADLKGRTSSEVFADLVPGARVVKTANTLRPDTIAEDPHVGPGRRVLFISGDHAEANTDVAKVLQKVGFSPVNLGGLATGGRMQQFPGGPLPTLNLIQVG